MEYLGILIGLVGIAVTIYFSKNYIMKKIKDTKIVQSAEEMENIKGAKFDLKDGEDLLIENLDIEQSASRMKNTTGLEFNASGKQSARLKGVHVKTPYAEIKISGDPNVKVEINKQM